MAPQCWSWVLDHLVTVDRMSRFSQEKGIESMEEAEREEVEEEGEEEEEEESPNELEPEEEEMVIAVGGLGWFLCYWLWEEEGVLL